MLLHETNILATVRSTITMVLMLNSPDTSMSIRKEQDTCDRMTLHDGDETFKLWKPLLTQFGFEKAHRSGSCNGLRAHVLAADGCGVVESNTLVKAGCGVVESNNLCSDCYNVVDLKNKKIWRKNKCRNTK